MFSIKSKALRHLRTRYGIVMVVDRMLKAGLEQQEVRSALQRMLESRAFRRSEQLKKLIGYLCEAELQGRREDLDEYRIGVSALGRPGDFSPELDSSVRTRTHALRQKLVEYYNDEGVAETLRIELPKGSYVPVFQKSETARPLENLVVTPRASVPWGILALAILITMLALAVGMKWIVPGPALTTPAILREFWRPALQSSRPIAICVGQPVHLWVRNYGNNLPPDHQYTPFPDPVPTSPTFERYFRERTGSQPGSGLVLHPSPNSSLWGDSAGAASALRFFTEQQIPAELLPESTLQNSYPLKGRTAIVFGRPEFSKLVNEITPHGGFQLRYVAGDRRHGIVHESDPRRSYFNSKEIDQENYGLITVLRPDTVAMQVVFCGITSDGGLAGIDYLTSAEGLTRIRKELGGSWPAKFQVVVRTRSINGYPVRTEYAAHHIF